MITAECQHCGTRKVIASTFRWENGAKVPVNLCKQCSDNEAIITRHLNILESLGGRVYA